MRKQTINYKKFEMVRVTAPQSILQAVEDLMVFDARCLDKETWRELLRVLPDLTRIRKAWRAHFTVHGCVCCRRKKTEYGAGGFCSRCLCRITTRMRTCFRQIDAGRNTAEEIAALTRKFDAAQMLFGSGEDSERRLQCKSQT
jgi:hypothetical protein